MNMKGCSFMYEEEKATRDARRIKVRIAGVSQRVDAGSAMRPSAWAEKG